MKKLHFLLFILLFAIKNVYFSQKVEKFELGFQSSLHLSAANTFSGYNEEQVLPDELTYSNTRGNFGAGFSFGLDLDKKVFPNVKFGLNLSYFKGSEVLMLNYDRDSLKQNLVGSTTQIRLNPKLSFSIPTKKITFLMESALLIPLSSKSTFTFNSLDQTTDSSLFYKENFTYNFAFGISQKLGFEAKLSTHFKLKTSLGILLFNQTTKESKISAYEINGNEQMNTMSTYEKESLYRQSLNNFSNNYTYNSFVNENSPKDLLKTSHQFTSYDFNIILIYTFGKITSD